MDKDKKETNEKIARIIYLVLLLVSIIDIYLPVKETVKMGIAIIIVGVGMTTAGILGLLNNEIHTGAPSILEYDEKSLLGKIFNVIYTSSGIIAVIIGIFVVVFT